MLDDFIALFLDEKKLGDFGMAALLPGVRFVREVAQRCEEAMQGELARRMAGTAEPAMKRGRGRPRKPEDVLIPGLSAEEQAIVNRIEAVTRPKRKDGRGHRPPGPDMIDGNYTGNGAAKLLGLSPGSMWALFHKEAVGRKVSWPKGAKTKVIVVTPAEMNRLLKERRMPPLNAKKPAPAAKQAGLNRRGKPVADGYWSRMTPEERKAEMTRRMKVHRGEAPSIRMEAAA